MSVEWNAEAYNRLSEPQLGWGLKVIERLRGIPLRESARVLDAGCGTGRVTGELLSAFDSVTVVGVDLSRNMLRRAAEDLTPRYPGRVSFLQADLSHLPFTAAFDAVFSTAVLHWVLDHGRLFQSLFAALRPGGWFVAQCGGGANLKRVRDRAAKLMAMDPYRVYFRDWNEPYYYADEATTEKRLCGTGFRNVRVWLQETPIILDSAKTYREYLATVTLHRHLERITDPRVANEFLDTLMREAAGNEGFTLDYWRLNVDARRPG